MKKELFLIDVEIDLELKEKVEVILKSLDLTVSEAINLFFEVVVKCNGLPFEIKFPNKETRKFLNDSDNGKNLIKYDSVDDMFEDLGI